jgi:hypothetical protein
MAGFSGPQTTGTTAPTVLSVLKTIFEQGVSYDVNVSCPAFAALSREGTKKLQKARTHKFAIKGNIGQSARTYGANDPCDGFAVCSAPPEYCDVELTYKKIYIPYRVCNETIQEAGSGGAMFDVFRQDLKDLAEQHGHHLERALFTGDGRDVLFTLADTGTDNGDGTWTYAVQWYGGLQGEEMGDILESLLLINMCIHVSDAVGNAARATAQADNSTTILDVDPTLGAETITVDDQIVAAAVGDVVYRSRQDTNGVQGATDGLTGFPLLIDDFSLADPFQGVASEDCPSFSARCCDNGGLQRDLTETLMEQALTTAMVRKGRRKGEKVTFQRHAFFTHEATARKFALSLTEQRRFTAPQMLGEAGMRPHAGIDMKFLTYDGVPFITSHLGLRNTVYLADLAELVIVHNGKAEGQFLSAPGGPTVERVACTPTFEYVWFAYLDFATRKRNGMVCIKDLTSFADC